MTDSLTLKWGTLKGWRLNSATARDACQRYFDIGRHSAGAMTQHDTPDQKKALCDLIDAVDCDTIENDWSGEDMSKDEAKAYVMGYGA